MVPFKPNIVKLSKQVGISRETLVRYLYLLERADLIMLLQTGTKGKSKMNKPERVYLNNTNLFYALSPGQANAGSIRETFFFNQAREKHDVRYAQSGDFVIDGKFTVEVGGRNKPQKQVRGIEKSDFYK